MDSGKDTNGYERVWETNCGAMNSGLIMWVISGSGSFSDHYERDPTGGITFTVTNPGTSKRVITVGAFASRPLDTQSFYNAGRIAYFSSRGPTRNGRIKPNIVAGGYFICSTNSEFSSHSDPYICAEGHYYVPFAGTSMATAVVMGLVALYLQDHSFAIPEEVKEWFSSNAVEDDNFLYPNVVYCSEKAVYVLETRFKGSGKTSEQKLRRVTFSYRLAEMGL
ncbi:S8 family serine peptidase [Aquifex aeolicus]|uniref:Uncharacterized protein aq_aa18 n=1 Tax=Aquifex aeolicus (strain VF5) TaxID=224324 RepID=YZ18_AQUAE|nr:S8 family serine peptidase [Aquifex aeolicus]O66409.1 RecName: Full=Uncharacterized protein aq_aa18 [Aquifex aeolicus VF5]AAC07961.1 putative protein [Aquifex aeolicus VF5]